jgi:hypothetical protein
MRINGSRLHGAASQPIFATINSGPNDYKKEENKCCARLIVPPA